MTRVRSVVVLLLVVLVAAPLAGARAGVVEEHLGPFEPTVRDFEPPFLPLLPTDRQAFATLNPWKDKRVAGWGGAYPGADGRCKPQAGRRAVVFVHGTTEDATFWRATPQGNGTIVNVRDEFLAAGWCPSQLWAISYTGQRGYFTYNDINADEVAEFLAAVRKYTGEAKIDLVSHSLGVTVVRKALFRHPHLYRHIGRFVALAGANHGTTTCRGVGTANGSEVCRELEPGSPWLDELNGFGETPKGPDYLTLYDPVGDHFYQGPDATSPELDGACNHAMPGELHNALARGQRAVHIYRAFLVDGTLPACR